MTTAAKLLKIKNKIDEAKNKKAEITGQIKSTIEQMKQKFDVDNLEDAELLLAGMGRDLDEKEAAFNKKLDELESAYDWN